MAHINILVAEPLKARFKGMLALESKEITETLNLFIKKYVSDPEKAKEFLAE